jgi:hypothetical protein
MRLIGICGRAGCGKDTLAAALCNQLGYIRYALAFPIKCAINALLDQDIDWDDRAVKEAPTVLGPSPRELAQTLGTEWGRNYVREDVWLVLAGMHYTKHRKPMIISDVRFDNEARWVRERNGIIIRIHRDEVDSIAPHVSELGISDELVDLEVSNNGTVDHLVETVVSALHVYAKSARYKAAWAEIEFPARQA